MSTDKPACEYADRDDVEVRYLAGRLPEEQADAFEAHYFACEACWTSVRRAREVRAAFAAAPGERTSVPVAPAPAATQPRRWWLAAAAALAVVALGTWQLASDGDAPSEAVLRGPADAWQPSARVSDGALLLAWPRLPAADVYHVRLFTADGALLRERTTADSSLALPLTGLPSVESGETVYWDVRALDRLREVVARAGPSGVVVHDDGP